MEPGGHPRLECYWKPSIAGVGGVSSLDWDIAEARKAFLGSLEEAVVRRLVSDVPLGAFLSGGIDSSLIVALMARHVDRPVRTFTIGFDDRDGYDERPYARLVAQRCD